MHTEFLSAVLSMGYRKMNDDLYAKPVGFGIFVISIDEKTISFNFAVRGKTMCWSTKPITPINVTDSIKEYECHNFRKSDDRCNDSSKNYEFLTREQETELLF